MVRRKTVKTIIVGATVGALLLGGAYSVLAATAQGATRYPPIVGKIAKAFNLDPAKVNGVFQDDFEARQTERKASLEKQLDQAVTDKKITAAQKTAILKKMDELQAKHESLRGMTPENRVTAMQELRAEIQTWAKDNGLDQNLAIPGLGAIMGGRGGGYGNGFGGHGMGGGRGGFMGGQGDCGQTCVPNTTSGTSTNL